MGRIFLLGGGEAFRNEVKEWSDSGTRKEKCFAFLAYKEIYPPNKKKHTRQTFPKNIHRVFFHLVLLMLVRFVKRKSE